MLEWDDSLQIGIKNIDDQHKELFIRYNQLLTAMRSGKGKEEIIALLDFLQKYVLQHFDDEEKIQKKYNYNKLTEQKAQHDSFKKKMDTFKVNLEKEGPTTQLVVSLQSEISQWLKTHIMTSDRDLGQFLKVNNYV